MLSILRPVCWTFLFASSLLAGAPQDISFPEVGSKLTTDPAFVLNATSSSGLPVNYKVVSSPALAKITGNTVTLTGQIGSVTVRASQAGDSFYDAAPEEFRTFMVVASTQRFAKVSAGHSHSVGIRADGSLWTWGLNQAGQLGLGVNDDRNVPVRVGSANNWSTLDNGGWHTLALRSDGTLWSWGDPSYGALGRSNTWLSNQPMRVGSASNWTAVACNYSQSIALRRDGTLWAWGNNRTGQLGLGDYEERYSPVQVGSDTTWAAIACGGDHTVALRRNGTLWAWGGNGSGQLGLGDYEGRFRPTQVGTDNDWTAISCGDNHTLALRRDGTLWVWGDNWDGQLGLGVSGYTLADISVPTRVGSVITWTAVDAGNYHSTALRSDGSLWVWGDNSTGELGLGDTVDRWSPTQGAPGVDNTVKWASVSAGYGHNIALRDGVPWTWGSNFSGELGLGYTDYGYVPDRTFTPPTAVYAPSLSEQKVTMPAFNAMAVGESVFLTASATSGLPIRYTVSGPATINGKVLTITGTGTVQVTANQDGDDNWLSALPVMQAVTVLPRQVVLLGNKQHVPNGDTSPSLAHQTDFGRVKLLNAYAKSTFTIANYGSATAYLLSPSLVQISGEHASDFRLSTAPASTIPAGTSTTFTITFDPSLPGLRQAIVSFAFNGAGTTPYNFAIRGFGVPDQLYTQTIAFNPPSVVYTGQEQLTLSAESSSGLPVTLTLTPSTAASLTDDVLTLLAPGTIKITAAQSGVDLYGSAPSVTRTITIKPTPTALTIINLLQRYDGTPKSVSTIGPGSTEVSVTYNGSATEPTNAGTYNVVATSGSITKKAILTISKAPLYVIPADQRRIPGGAFPVFTASFEGFVAGQDESVVTSPIALKTTAKTTSPGGIYPINASGGQAPNYQLVYRKGTLVVESFGGAYEALLLDGEGLPVGKLGVTISQSGGTYTGKLYLATESTALSIGGTHTANPADQTTTGIASAIGKSGAAYSINFNLGSFGSTMTAQVTTAAGMLGESQTGRRLLVLSKGQRIAYSGSYTAQLESPAPSLDGVSEAPAGAGWAKTTIDSKGTLKLVGKLGDGAGFTAALAADAEPDPGYRWFVQPYQPARTESFIGGAFQLAPHPNLPGMRHLPAATLTWTKQGNSKDATYRSGFDPVETNLVIDPWLKPSKTETLPIRLGLDSTISDVVHTDSGSGSQGVLPTKVSLSDSRITALEPVGNASQWKATIAPADGTYTGSFVLTDAGIKRVVFFTGILRQPMHAEDLTIGIGHYLLPTLPGDTITGTKTGEVRFTK